MGKYPYVRCEIWELKLLTSFDGGDIHHQESWKSLIIIGEKGNTKLLDWGKSREKLGKRQGISEKEWELFWVARWHSPL